MCGRRRNHCCGGPRQRRQPLLAQAVVAGAAWGYGKYNERRQQRAIVGPREYPDTLDAPAETYRDQPPMPYAANANAMYTERDEKAPIPREPTSRAVGEDTAPPAYDDIAPPAGPPPQRQALDQDTPRSSIYVPQPPGAYPQTTHNYPQHPQAMSPQQSRTVEATTVSPREAGLAFRPRPSRRHSSASSVSSLSSLSSLNHDLSTRGLYFPPLSSKRAMKQNRRTLKRALKHAGTMENAHAAVLTSISRLFGVDDSHLADFGVSKVDLTQAVVLTAWAKKAAKSRVDMVALKGQNMDMAAGIIAGASRKVRLGRR